MSCSLRIPDDNRQLPVVCNCGECRKPQRNSFQPGSSPNYCSQLKSTPPHGSTPPTLPPRNRSSVSSLQEGRKSESQHTSSVFVKGNFEATSSYIPFKSDIYHPSPPPSEKPYSSIPSATYNSQLSSSDPTLYCYRSPDGSVSSSSSSGDENNVQPITS